MKLRSTLSELKRIREHFERSAGEPGPVGFRPVFNEYAIANVLRHENAFRG